MSHQYKNTNTLIGSFSTNTRGNIIISFSLALIPFIAATGVAIDYGRGVYLQTHLQSTTDAAALAAASLTGRSQNDRTAMAARVFAANALSAGQKTALKVLIKKDEVTVHATALFANTFMKALGRAVSSVDARSTAVFGAIGGPCVLTLNKSSKESLLLNSKSRINAPDCRVHVNSRHREALFANSQSDITAESICVKGRWKTNGGSSLTPQPDSCHELADPLAHLTKPREANGSCDWTDLKVTGRATLRPGVYCKRLELDSGARVTFEPGIYVMRDGEFIVNSGARAKGRDLMMYLEGSNNPRFNINSASHIAFSGRTSGPYAGLVFFQERGSRADSSILNSNSSSIIEGVIYLPSTSLHLNSEGVISNASPWTGIIVDKLELNSNSVLNINTNYAASSVPAPAGIGPGEGRSSAVWLKE